MGIPKVPIRGQDLTPLDATILEKTCNYSMVTDYLSTRAKPFLIVLLRYAR